MSQTAIEFLRDVKKLPESVRSEMDPAQARGVARTMGWVAPAVEAKLVTYTPKAGSGKEGLYLDLAIGKSRPSMHRICDGVKLTEEGQKILAEAANQIADLIG